jgi:ribosomal-protein-alanine N-acetyltransferase
MWPQTAYKRELQANSMARYLVIGDQNGDRGTSPAATTGTPAGVVKESDATGLGHVVRSVRRIFSREGTAPAASLPPEEYLVGFAGLWFMLEECHVVTVAVREARRRQGIGELLVITAIELAQRKSQDVLTLECRVSNRSAQTLYEKYGFRNVGVRKRYYTDDNEDALIMTTPPIHTPEYTARFERLRAEHERRWGVAQIAHPEL